MGDTLLVRDVGMPDRARTRHAAAPPRGERRAAVAFGLRPHSTAATSRLQNVCLANAIIKYSALDNGIRETFVCSVSIRNENLWCQHLRYQTFREALLCAAVRAHSC